MTPPKLSIITPSFNQAAYLEKTITSVLSQNLMDFEYVVIDGESKDNSLEIITKYADQLAGWVSEKDKGQADGINKGAARTSGEIIGWINSDDYYLPGAFKKAVRFFETHPEVDLLYGDVISINGAGEMINVMRFANYSVEDLMTFRVISQPGVFFRRRAWDAAGGMDPAYHFLLDHHLWLRIAAQGKIAYIPEPLAAARFYPEAKNRAHPEAFGKEAYALCDWMAEDPLFSARMKPIENHVRGGAHWLDAHYLSEGGQSALSLKQYRKAFSLFPERVKEDRRRVLLTLFQWASPKASEAIFERQSAKRLKKLQSYQNLLTQQ